MTKVHISVLFCAKNSVYKTLGADCWDEDRDALNWPGGNPGIFHPPCRLFCQLRHLSTAPVEEKQLAYWSVDQVRKWGGVLEHPALSQLWQDCALPRPDSLFGDGYGFSAQIDQFRFGHPARKLTWLYFVGCTPAPVPAPAPGRYAYPFAGQEQRKRWGNRNSRPFPHVPKSFRSTTPVGFAQWLIETVLSSTSLSA
jgi:hypothetical protein